MKFNWGTGIALFYTTFAVVMVSVVIRSTYFDNSLVADNYYQQDLEYQQHIDKVNNASALAKDLVISQNLDEQYLRFQFPNDLAGIKGDIFLFRPSDESKDLHLPISPDSLQQQIISTKDLIPGLWRVKVDWQSDDRSFYKEVNLTL